MALSVSLECNLYQNVTLGQLSSCEIKGIKIKNVLN